MTERDWISGIKWISGLIIGLGTFVGAYLINENSDIKEENRMLNIKMIETQRQYIETITRNTNAFERFSKVLESIEAEIGR